MEKQVSVEEINEMYVRSGLSVETVHLLRRYFAAFANLYGVINLSDAYKIIEKQNPGMITFDELHEFSSIIAFEREHHYYIVDMDEMFDDIEGTPKTREIVNEYLLAVDEKDYYELIEKQNGKPFYIPEKEKLLKYEDEFYYEKTHQTEALEKFFIKKHIVGEALLDVMAEMQASIILDGDIIDNAFLSIGRLRIELTNREVEIFGNLLCDMANNFRIPSNRGYTPNELSKIMLKTDNPPEIVIGDNMKQLLISGEMSGADFLNSVIDSGLYPETKKSLLRQFAEITGNKADSPAQKQISKNAPCPCGSGKKYKRCCGKGKD